MTKNKLGSVLIFLALLLSLIPAALPEYDAHAQEELVNVSLQPDGTQGNDTHIVSSAASTNYGTATGLGVGESNAATLTYRSILTFDLSGLPYDLQATVVTLTLTVDQDLADNGGTIEAYAVYQDWLEAQTTWNDRKNFTPWQVAGASGANDLWAQPIGTLEVVGDMTPGTQIVIPLDIDGIVAIRRGNFYGILLRTEAENNDLYIFRSSDHATEADRPKLDLTYNPDALTPDPGWICVDGQYATDYPLQTCPSYALMSPFTQSGSYTGATGMGKSLTAGEMQCDPFPRCQNDFEVYYRVTYQVSITGSGHVADPQFYLIIPGVTNRYWLSGQISCGTGPSSCQGVFEGRIPVSSLPSSDQMFTVGLGVILWSSTPSTRTLNYSLFLSTKPFDEKCSDTWYVPLPETFEIDPTIETPLGINGTPSDHQIYETVIGQTYMVRVEDGPWNDGSNDRTDAAVSLDGVGWMTWADFTLEAICLEVIPATGANPDYKVIYFTATTETFYIRANDEEGEFADNEMDPLLPPYSYVIGLAFELAEPVTCEAQFTYDEVNDWIASINLPSTSDDVQALSELSEPLEPGAWYGIEVASGTWSDSGGPPRIDMEFKFSILSDWADLAEGSDLVYCVSDDGTIVYIQAPMSENLDLHLRVNDQDDPQNWADNTGTLGVNIYNADFTRIISGCELQYDVSNLVAHDTVEGTASNGKAFGFVFSSDELDVSYSYGLTPGGWYMVETTDGPWYQTFTGGGYEQGKHYYDMQVKTGSGGAWSSFEDWTQGECVVDIDALGHQRVYFQAPSDGGAEYFLRIAGAGPFTRGWMGWNLYQAIDLGINGLEECGDFVYNPESTLAIGGVDSWLSNGSYINGLANNEYFAIQIESANTASDPPYYELSGWFESDGGEERDDLELTIDGSTWQDLPNHPAVLCYYYTPVENELVFFIRVLNGQQWRMRANSTTFSDNVGTEIYRVFSASAGDLDPWATCMDDYTATVPALNEHEWIPPQDEEGVMLMPTLTYNPDADDDDDGVIIWGEPGLEPDHTYKVETKSGPWYDGESPDGKYLAQLSSDDGETWYLFGEHPDVICYKREQTQRYWAAIFNVTVGQRWKIRVADTETDVFTDNSGNLAYKLNLVNEFPIDGPGDLADDYDPNAFDVCIQALVRPATLTLSEIGSLGNYIGDWIHYINRSLLSYFAWCPRHTDLLLSAMRALSMREPLATISELSTVSRNVVADVESYDWEGGYDDTSIFNVTSQGGVDNLVERVLPTSGDAFAPWEEGGDLVNFSGGGGLPSYYYTCDSVFANYLPSRIRTGVCFTSAYWKETGASFWVQLTLDIGAIFLLFRMIKGAAQSLVYMMTGVRPWTKDGASRMIVEVANGQDLIQPVDRWRTRRR